MIIILSIILILGAILAWYGSEVDIKSSDKFPWYGGKEGIKISKDKFGWFKTTQNRIGSYVVIVAIAVASVIFEFYFQPYSMVIGGIVLGGVGLARWIRGKTNEKQLTNNRNTRQIPLLRIFRENNAVVDTIGQLGAFQSLPTDKPERHFYRIFGWVYSTNPDKTLAQEEVNRRLVEISKKPESEWFPR